MRISDWSSDVCSSDLLPADRLPTLEPPGTGLLGRRAGGGFPPWRVPLRDRPANTLLPAAGGRAGGPSTAQRVRHPVPLQERSALLPDHGDSQAAPPDHLVLSGTGPRGRPDQGPGLLRQRVRRLYPGRWRRAATADDRLLARLPLHPP